MSEADEILDGLARHVVIELRRIGLTPEERAFVDAAGREMASHLFEYLCKYPEKEKLRPFVMAWALACNLNAADIWERGVDRCDV